MKSYKGDPRQITAKFGSCKDCGQDVKGKSVYYFPQSRAVYCLDCGDEDYRRFIAAAQDEAVSNNEYI